MKNKITIAVKNETGGWDSEIEDSRKMNEAFVQNLSGDMRDRCFKSIFRYYEDGRQEMTERKWDGIPRQKSNPENGS